MAHLSLQKIHEFQERQLSLSESDAVLRHIRDCEECRNAAMKSPGFQKGFDSIRSQVLSDAHPSFDELAANVDGDKEFSWIEEHLAGCADCRIQVEDMRQVKKELAPVPFRSARSAGLPVGKMLMAAGVFLVLLAAAWFFRSTIRKPETKIVQPVPPVHQPAVPSLVVNDNGYRIEVDRSGKIKPLPQLSSERMAMLEEVVSKGKLPESPDLTALNPEAEVLLGEPRTGRPFRLVQPLAVIVLSRRPEFRWKPLAGATSYQVVVTDRKLNVVAISPEIRDTHWAPEKDLQRGVIYSWQVIATKNGQAVRSPTSPAPQALFQVLPADRAAVIEQALREKAPGLVIAAMMSQAGVKDEAAEQLHHLELQNPGNPLIKRLLQEP